MQQTMVDNKMNVGVRREKSANYTRAEKHLLLDKIVPFLDIIENKRTDTVTVEAKTRAWDQVAVGYNESNPRGRRKINQLKNLYENLKKRVKKDLINDRDEFSKTGIRNAIQRIDEVGWRLIKLIPKLKAICIDPEAYLREHLENADSGENCYLYMVENCEKDSNQPASSPPHEVITVEEMKVHIKEEMLPDLVDVPELPSAESNGSIEVMETNTPLKEAPYKESDLPETDEMYELEKEIKRKEIEKLNLDIQVKQVEIEYMKAKLKEQELQVKFKELEYQVKYKESINKYMV